jgi:hypothetical protein
MEYSFGTGIDVMYTPTTDHVLLKCVLARAGNIKRPIIPMIVFHY